MNVSGISQTSSLYGSQSSGTQSVWRQNFQALGSALQSGNLSAAQSAFAALTQNASGSVGSSTSSSSPNQTLAQDLNTLATALKSGNVSDAQKAFATFQQDLTSVSQTHHHHHHHGSQSTAATATDTTDSSASAGATALTSLGSTINLTA